MSTPQEAPEEVAEQAGEQAAEQAAEQAGERAPQQAPVTVVETPIRVEYRYTPGESPSRFLRGIEQGKLLGRRCPQCRKVYLPPRGACSMCGALFAEEVEVADTGTVTTFCVVNLNFANRAVDLPYVCAEVLFDGADITAQLLLQGADPHDVRMGMRVRAHWADELVPSMASIAYVEPSDEPDAPFESYAEYV